MRAQDIVYFWFTEIEEKKWWVKDPAFDAFLKRRFGAVHRAACAGELSSWRTDWCGRLAEIIVIDQFSRNIYRDSAKAFAWDGIALTLAQEAVRLGLDRQVPHHMLAFLYIPYMHSESAAIHEVAVKLFTAAKLESNIKFELAHKAIIDRFGRYPHRNAALGRKSTAAELEFLSGPGSSF